MANPPQRPQPSDGRPAEPLGTLGRLRRRLYDIGLCIWQRGRELELLHRAMGFAALAFVTLIPLLIVIAAASPVPHADFASWVVEGLGLSGKSADAVRRLFSSPRGVLSATTGFSVAATALFGVTFVSAVQVGYSRIWQVALPPWHAAWRHAIGLAGLIGYLLVAVWLSRLWQDSPFQPTLRLTVTVVGGVLLFWWLQWLLLAGRVGWRRLLSGSLATVAALAGLRGFSQLVFAPLIVSNAVSYGAIGTVLVVQSWLIGVGYTVYAGAIVGWALWATRSERGG